MEEHVLPIIDSERCTGCGLCARSCSAHAVDMVDTWPVIARPDDCAYCGLCEEICPAGAVALAYEIVLSSTSDDPGPSGM